MFHCAQSKDCHRKSQKIEGEELQQDKLAMDTFECHGWLHITLHYGTSIANIKIEHKEDHILYCSIYIHEEIKAMIVL